MSPTHWQGPLYGSDQARGGLFRGMLVDAGQYGIERDTILGDPDLNAAGGNLHRWVWQDHFVENRFGEYWTQTNVVAGTASITVEAASTQLGLSHGTADQGPSVRYLGTVGGGDSICRSASGVPGSWCFETRTRHNVNVTTNDAFVGFMTSAAAHPLQADGTLNLAGVANGVGFHWLAANAGRPLMVAWQTGAAETLLSPPILATDVVTVFREFGVRINGAAAGGAGIEWYLGGRRIHQHRMSAAFSGRMTFGMGLISNVAGAQFHSEYVSLAFRH